MIWGSLIRGSLSFPMIIVPPSIQKAIVNLLQLVYKQLKFNDLLASTVVATTVESPYE